MASQSQKGGGSWSGYLRDKAVRLGAASYLEGQPLDYNVAKTLGIDLETNGAHAIAVQRMYEAGRLMAAEAKAPLPPPAARVTKDINAFVAKVPAMCKQFATEQSLARAEAKRAAALRLRLMARERSKAAGGARA